jgi:hypothetical protein
MTVVASLKSALNGCFPNKHPLTKAKLLMDEISSSRLFNGEPLKLMQIFAQHYVRDLFKPWRMLKAADELSVGAFKTATVKALNKVRDYERLGLFSSASSVDRARAKLDQYAFELIGYERHGTVYGEVFYLNFENALHYLLRHVNWINLPLQKTLNYHSLLLVQISLRIGPMSLQVSKLPTHKEYTL